MQYLPKTTEKVGKNIGTRNLLMRKLTSSMNGNYSTEFQEKKLIVVRQPFRATSSSFASAAAASLSARVADAAGVRCRSVERVDVVAALPRFIISSCSLTINQWLILAGVLHKCASVRMP